MVIHESIIRILSSEKETVQICKALQSKTRIDIMRLTLWRELNIRQLASRLQISEAAVSLAVKKLHKAGLVISERKTTIDGHACMMVKATTSMIVIELFQEMPEVRRTASGDDEE